MANSKIAIAKVIKEEAGFQNSPKDSGNFYKEKLIGTKYGITPNAFFSYYKTEPTQDTIKNLTVDQAIPIYKKNYWDKIRGDEIANESVADLMMFVVVNSGAGLVKTLKKIMNITAGKNIVAETSTPFTSAEIKLLNALPQSIYFNNLKIGRERFYKDLATNVPKNKVFLKGWLNRLNKHVYSGKKSFNYKPVIITLTAAGVIAAAVYFRNDIKRAFA